MRYRPSFTSDTEIIGKLTRDYGLPLKKLQFLPVGEDSWCYLAEEDERNWFVKIARRGLYPPSVIIPALLQNVSGYRFVNPVVPDRQGLLWNKLAEHDFVVYPFVKGITAMDCVLSAKHWQGFGRMLAMLHETRLDEDTRHGLKVEDFVPSWADGAKRVVMHAATEDHLGAAGELVQFIQERESEIRAIIARAEELGRKLQRHQLELVLCHADPNLSNILLAEDGRILLVDWDGVMLAPRERDLMFFTGEGQEAFMCGYDSDGTYKFNLTAIAYYKYEWVVQEFYDYGSRIFFANLDEVEKQYALKEFVKLFDRGDVVQDAYEADADLTDLQYTP
ncbi:MAG TPA: phosphotransferase [Ktedonobacteraceae bacterium]|nr:phosphotransferase [Ktedonobacteraceae bacterium]